MLSIPSASSSRPPSISAQIHQRVSALGSSMSLATASSPITEDQELNEVEALKEDGEIAAKDGRHRDALLCFGEALEIDSTRFDIRAFKVRSHILVGELEAAAKEAKVLTQMKPTHPLGFQLLGRSRAALYQHREAIQAFMDGVHSCILTGQQFQRQEIVESLVRLVASFSDISVDEREKIDRLDETFDKILELGILCFAKGFNRHALLILGNLRSIHAERATDDPGQAARMAKLSLLLGQVYSTLNKTEHAKTSFEKCKKAAEAFKDPDLLYQAVTELSALYRAEGNHAASISASIRVLDAYYELRSSSGADAAAEILTPERMSRVHRELAEAYLDEGLYDKAESEIARYLHYLRKSSGIRKRPAEIEECLLMGRLFEETRKLEDAKRFYEKLVKMESEEEESSMGIEATVKLCRVLCRKGERKKAGEMIEDARKKFGLNGLNLETKMDLAKVLKELREFDESRELYLDLRKGESDSLSKEQFFSILHDQGEAYLEEERLDFAKYYANEAQTVAALTKNEKLMSRAWFLLSRTLKHYDDRQSLERAESLLKVLLVNDRLISQESWERGTKPRYEILERLEECFKIIQEVYVKLRQFENALLYAELFQLTKNEMQTLQEHWPHSPMAHRGKSMWRWESLSQSISLLGAPCLVYSLIGDKLFMWFIEENGSIAFQDHREVNLYKKLEKHIKKLIKCSLNEAAGLEIRIPLGRMLIGDASDGKLLKRNLQPTIPVGNEDDGFFEDESQRELYDYLLKPFEEKLKSIPRKQKVMIMPDGILASCPFIALKSDAEEKRFGEMFDLITIPYLQLARILKNNEKNKTEREQTIQSLREMTKISQVKESYERSKQADEALRSKKGIRNRSTDFSEPIMASNPRLFRTVSLEGLDPRCQLRRKNSKSLSEVASGKTEPGRKNDVFLNGTIDEKKLLRSSLPSTPGDLRRELKGESMSVEKMFFGYQQDDAIANGINSGKKNSLQIKEKTREFKTDFRSSTLKKDAVRQGNNRELNKRKNDRNVKESKENAHPPDKLEWLLGIDNCSTLATSTATETEIVGAKRNVHRFSQVSRNDRAGILANPLLPTQLALDGRVWEPLGQLDKAQSEAIAVARYLRADPMMGAAATKDAAVSCIKGCAVIHVATAGSFEEGFLIFAPNKHRPERGIPEENSYILRTSELSQFSISAQLVVLSGALKKSGSLPIDRRLPLAFLFAGASTVLLQRWPIPTEATEKFFRALYSRLEGGARVTRAFSIAVEALASDGRFETPFFWAAFELVGDDCFLRLRDLHRSMLHQAMDEAEAARSRDARTERLNVPPEVDGVLPRAEYLRRLQENLGIVFRDFGEKPEALRHVATLIEEARGSGGGKEEEEERRKSEAKEELYLMPKTLEDSAPCIAILHLLGFAFHPRLAYPDRPYVVFPDADRDDLLGVFEAAIVAAETIGESPRCRFALYRLLPMSNELVGELLAILSASVEDAAYRVDLERPVNRRLWMDPPTRHFLESIGCEQISTSLLFRSGPNVARLKESCKTLFKALFLTPRQIERLRGPNSKKILPTLKPVVLPDKSIHATNSWASKMESVAEMESKMSLASEKERLEAEAKRERKMENEAHRRVVAAQAQDAFNHFHKERKRPGKVKVFSGETPSVSRFPVRRLPILDQATTEQRRDYAHFLLERRAAELDARFRHRLAKAYAPAGVCLADLGE